MAQCFEIKNKRLIFLDNGSKYIDDDDKKHISGVFTEIEFPSCYTLLSYNDFDSCRTQLAEVTKLDFSKAVKIEDIDEDTFTGAKSLEVVVLPQNVHSITTFYDCPLLKEIHIYNMEDMYGITGDGDKRLTIYASKISADIDSLNEGFLNDVGTLYVPTNIVQKFEKLRDENDDDIDIRPLPDDYTFPTVALSKPWKSGGVSAMIDLDELYDSMQYYCVLGGQSFGPVSKNQFANMARFGIVNNKTLVWKDGESSWAFASTMAELRPFV